MEFGFHQSSTENPWSNIWRRTRRFCIRERLRQRSAKKYQQIKAQRVLDEVGKAQWDREMRMQVRARASSSSFALGRAVAAPDQSTVRPFRGCTGRKFSVIGVDLLSSPKCSAENWESCKTQQAGQSFCQRGSGRCRTMGGVVLPH